MTYQDYNALISEARDNFANGKKPTYDQWLEYTKLFTAALWTTLDTSVALQALKDAGITTGSIVKNETMQSIFASIYGGDNEHTMTMISALNDLGFKNGDVPTEISFSSLVSIAMTSDPLPEFKATVVPAALSGFQNGLSSIGANIKTYEDTLQIANSSSQGDYLTISGSSYESKNWISIPNYMPITGSYTIELVTYGCTWSSSARYVQIYDNVNMMSLGKNIASRNGNVLTVPFKQAITLQRSYNNQLLFMVTTS